MSNLAIFNKTINDSRTQQYLDGVLKENKQSFVTSLVSVVANNTMLQACEPLTIMYAAMKAATLKLPIDPNIGAAYVIPYKNKGKDEAQFQLGYKGFIQLAMRSGQFLKINVREVKEGELVDEDFISGDITFKKLGEAERLKAKTIGYVAYFKLANGFDKTLYMSKEEVTAHAQRFSKAFSYGPWKSDFDAMAKKTVLKNLLQHYAPLSVEMQSAVKADQAVFHTADLQEEYIDNAQTEAEEEKNEQVEAVKAKAQAIKERARRAVSKQTTIEVEGVQVEEKQEEEVVDLSDEQDIPEEMFDGVPGGKFE